MIAENPEAYKAQIDKAVEAGKPIIQHDTAMLEAHCKAMAELAEGQAKAKAGYFSYSSFLGYG